MRALAALRAYGAHADPSTRIANTIALLVGLNGPFYPAYVWFLVPEAGPYALATMAMSPAFLAIPWLSRRRVTAARAALPIAGLLNTVWAAALLGPATGVGAFAYPCLALALLCWREPWLMLMLLGAGLVAQQAVLHMPVVPLAGLAVTSQSLLESLNVTSVGALMAFAAITIAREMRAA
ncbi:hypothetical protein [Neoroseomonas soli]|uniref:Uncharacterized protein n=1 Tax=Neoroseomonas soli TaxID=1081025 RepID=A0A9X9WZ72_9PROT|nr:hypothetical protein [Neoroseomonas soli]MBR0672451.1 hypothetical protein [Neoroseomonas soli]